MGSYGSQSVSAISELMAHEALLRHRLNSEPKISVLLPESVVHRFAQITAPEPFTLDPKHALIAACRTALEEENGYQ